MTRKILGILLIALCGLSGTTFAETVYIPLVAGDRAGGTYETQVSITNTGTAAANFTTYKVAHNNNGIPRNEGAEQGVLLLGGSTFETTATGLGLYEITSQDPNLVAHARLIGNVQGEEVLGSEIPVISRANAIEANTTYHLQGWVRDGNLVTDFGLVNLGFQEATCFVDVLRVDGSVIADGVLLTWQPRSQRHFTDALSLLNLEGVRSIRAAVICNQAYYPYITQFENTTGEMLFVGPSAKVEDGVSDPADSEFVWFDELLWTSTYNVRNGPNKNVSGFEPHAPGGEVGGYKAMEINGITYPRGVSWFPGWGDSKVTWNLEGRYKRFQAVVRVDDEKFGQYEWAVVNRATGQFIRIERPPQGFNGPENNTRFRVGAGCSIQIVGDGVLLYESPEFYAYGPEVNVDVDIQGVDQLDIILKAGHSEQANAPHRAGLTSTPARVETNTFHDLLNLAAAKLILDN